MRIIRNGGPARLTRPQLISLNLQRCGLCATAGEMCAPSIYFDVMGRCIGYGRMLESIKGTAMHPHCFHPGYSDLHKLF
eukprot:4888165-Karenia_brevis.AAC.1